MQNENIRVLIAFMRDEHLDSELGNLRSKTLYHFEYQEQIDVLVGL